MKVKCVRLLSSSGDEIEYSSWLTIGQIYHVMSLSVDKEGRRSYGIINRHPEGEWPQMGNHSAECFEVVSEVIPSNWCEWERGDFRGAAPAAWQVPGFYEAFYDHEPATYPVFERERDLIMKEDP